MEMNQEHPITQEELHAQLRHILGYCIYTPAGKECLHEPCDKDDEEEIKTVQAFITTHYTPNDAIRAAIPKSYKAKIGMDVAQLRESADATDGYNQALSDVRKALNLDSGTETKNEKS